MLQVIVAGVVPLLGPRAHHVGCFLPFELGLFGEAEGGEGVKEGLVEVDSQGTKAPEEMVDLGGLGKLG